MGKSIIRCTPGLRFRPSTVLFIYNDIQDHIQPTMRLFADDSIVYCEIVRPEDHDILQQDLQALAHWSSTWLMQFNIKKCAILTITRKRTPSHHPGDHHQYKIFGETLESPFQEDMLLKPSSRSTRRSSPDSSPIPFHTKKDCFKSVYQYHQGFWIYLYFRIRHSFAHLRTILNKMASFGVNIYGRPRLNMTKI